MTNRDIMRAVLAGEIPDATPQWLMAFSSTQLMRALMPEELHYEGYGEYSSDGAYPFGPMGEARLAREAAFNKHIDRCAFPVGWGANAGFGHCGPGEINKRIVEKQDTFIVVEYETGAKKEIRFHPHNVHPFDMPVRNRSDMDRLELPDPDDPVRYAGFAQDVVWAKSYGEWTVGWVNGFFSGVHYFLRDYAEFLCDLASDREFARILTEKMGNWTLSAARHLCETGVDCIGFCDDLGSGQSLLFSPATYRELVLPWHRKLCELVHGYGAVVHMHSHGAIMSILPDIASTGIDIINPLDPDEQLHLDQVRSAVGPRVVLCGGMNKHFFDWPKDDQVEHLRHVLKMGRRSGPHILMDSGGIPDSVTRPCFDWFLEISRELRYSIPV